MTEAEEQDSAWLEKRDDERKTVRLEIKFKRVGENEAATLLASEDFGQALTRHDSHAKEPHDAHTQNLSISGLKLVGDINLVGGKALNVGDHVIVEIQVPDAPIPVHSLAVVVWSDSDDSDPVKFYAGLQFMGINRQDVAKVARFLVLQRRAKQI
jgi:hypothetical protein